MLKIFLVAYYSTSSPPLFSSCLGFRVDNVLCCSTRLKIDHNVITKGKDGNYLVHTLNNTVLATPRGLIAFLENNVNEDGSVNIPVTLRPYMGGKDKILPKK